MTHEQWIVDHATASNNRERELRARVEKLEALVEELFERMEELEES